MKRILSFIFHATYLAFCFLFLFSRNALAYIDPSTTTFLVQAIVGVGVAIVAAVAVYWRKAKKKVASKLGIDENANKDVESDDIQFTKDSSAVDANRSTDAK